MNQLLLFIYDDRTLPDHHFCKVIGEQARFSEIIYKRQSFYSRTRSLLDTIQEITSICTVKQPADLESLVAQKSMFNPDTRMIHMYSYALVTDENQFSLLVQKLYYSQHNVVVMNNDVPLLLYFTNAESYLSYLSANDNESKTGLLKRLDLSSMNTDSLYDISGYSSFIRFLSGGFDARFFNTLNGTDYTVVKKSTDKKKIKMEYTFYHLLPEEMRSWFVLPYHYSEGEDGASYTMERYHMADMAIRWTHNAIPAAKIAAFLEKAMIFINQRNKKTADREQSAQTRNTLYLDKVQDRIALLKDCKEFPLIEGYIKQGTAYEGIDEVFARYKRLYANAQNKIRHLNYLCIGHGDFCFSNILYDDDTRIMRLIDPKGALTEADLWTDPYYDIAKLSHSICGLYDYIISGQYNIELNQSMQFELDIPFDNVEYKKLFYSNLERNGFHCGLTRLYEASLFLSMLPLHIDHPHKVLAFLLIALKIMNEVESEWKI